MNMQNLAQPEQMRNTWNLQPKDAMVLAMPENPTYRRSAAELAEKPTRKPVARRALIAAAVGALVPYGFGAAEYGVLLGSDPNKLGIMAFLMAFCALICGLFAVKSSTGAVSDEIFDDIDRISRDQQLGWDAPRIDYSLDDNP